MPRTTTVTPPSFDDLTQAEQVFVQPVQDTSLSGTEFIQDFIFDSFWTGLFTFSLIISLVFAIGIVYSMLRVRQIRKAEARFYAQQPLSSIARRTFGEDTDSFGGGESEFEERWRSILSHVNADNTNDWKQAILEADVLLDTIITRRGYTGDGIGEKMKQIKRSDINSIEDAWEAHKIRNRVAHEGSDFELTQREARRVINLYEKVFIELEHLSQ